MRTTASVDEHAWGLARRGHHVAVLGRVSLEPPAGSRPVVVRVRCQPGGRELAPLVDASRKINGRLGDPRELGHVGLPGESDAELARLSRSPGAYS